MEEMWVPLEPLGSHGAPAPAPAVTQSTDGSADANCRADCMAAWHIMTDDSSVFLQAIEGDTTTLPSGCVYFAFLVACAWISSSASASAPGVIEPQDLPDHRMPPTAAIVHGVRKTFTAAGRASRSEYWSYVVFVTATMFGSAALHKSLVEANASAWISAAVGHNGTTHPNPRGAELLSTCSACLHVVLPTALLLSFLFATVRRLHDSGRSGWRLLLVPVPFGVLFVAFWLLSGSEPRRNAFGSVPTNRSWRESDSDGLRSTSNLKECQPTSDDDDALREDTANAKGKGSEDCENPLRGVAVEVGREDLPEHLRHAVD